jgi:hypothetical protein
MDMNRDDLYKLWFRLCKTMITHLDGVYEIGKFIKMKEKYPMVPTAWTHSYSHSKLETVARIKNFLSAPSLLVVLRNIFGLTDEISGYVLPDDMIDRVVLDMEALQHNLVPPSFVQSELFYQKLLGRFLAPRRWDLDDAQTPLPGAFPETDSKSPGLDAVIETDTLSSPSLHLTSQNSTKKTDHIRSEILAAEMSRLTTKEPPLKHYGSSHDHHAIEKGRIADFSAKQLLTTDHIGAVKAILRNRKMPKRLGMTRAPKSVRHAEGAITPQQRTRLGRNLFRRLSKPGDAKKAIFVDDNHLLQAGPRLEARDGDELIYPSTQRMHRHVESIIRGAKRSRPQPPVQDEIDPSLAIEKILSLPSIEPLAISDDTKTSIALKKEKAAQKAADEARRLAEEQARRQREERLAKSGGLRVPEQPFVPSVSSNWHAKALATLRASAETTLATTGEGVNLRRHDFAKVVPATEWLNDEIVNGSLNWLDQFVNSAAGIKDVKKATRKCLALNSFFFKRLQEQGVGKTQRTLRRYGVDKKNLLAVETLLLPICEHLHWTLLVIRPNKRTIAHMDSMNSRGSQSYINIGLAWIKDVLEECFAEDEWKVVQHESPRQTNGYDCGVHTITNGMCLALGLNPIDSYNIQDMPQQRVRLACMLLNGGFKGDFDLRLY